MTRYRFFPLHALVFLFGPLISKHSNILLKPYFPSPRPCTQHLLGLIFSSSPSSPFSIVSYTPSSWPQMDQSHCSHLPRCHSSSVSFASCLDLLSVGPRSSPVLLTTDHGKPPQGSRQLHLPHSNTEISPNQNQLPPRASGYIFSNSGL